MKSIITNTHGRSCNVDYSRTSSAVDGAGQSSSETGQQEASSGSSGSSSDLRQRSERDRIWNEIEYLLGSLSKTKALLSDGTDWDPDEIKWIKERYRLSKRQALNYVLCLNISEVLDTVSFPGEHLSYLEVAKRVIIGCTVWELAEAIREMGLNPCQRVYYKASTDLVSVERAEAVLREMIGVGNYVLAGDFTKELAIPVKSATYTALKKELVSRGWKWGSKKVNKEVVWVIRR